MAKFILGTKLGMSQMADEKGNVMPVTVVEVAPNVIVQLRTMDKDGYEAVQIGTGNRKKLSKAMKGHLKNLGNFRYLREFKTTTLNDQALKVGDKVDVSIFEPGEMVKISGVSKGKGFQGGMKRHGFHGMPNSHGHHHVKRHIGSIGQRFPQHTLKGKKMAGRMGADRITVRGLKIMKVDTENGLLAVRGAVPGNRGGLLDIVSLK
ncbi:MAG: 50S ribosomal protein L3 [Candidatus Yanofskybacteria bacterium]|nr:50S ribosomal protein L3 [Candidatus Yanofskybacteria bacterium]